MRVKRRIEPENVAIAHIHTLEIESPHDARYEEKAWTHLVPHPFKDYVVAQVFDYAGKLLPIPGVSRSWAQLDYAIALPVLDEDHYPITVVIVG